MIKIVLDGSEKDIKALTSLFFDRLDKLFENMKNISIEGNNNIIAYDGNNIDIEYLKKDRG